MVIEKVGKLPVNSRIFIDYTQNPVEIKFEYPDPDTNTIRNSEGVLLPALFFGCLMFLALFAMWLYIFQPMFYPHITTADTTITNVTVNQLTYPNGTSYGFNSLFITYNWNDKPRYTVLNLNHQGYIWIIPYFYDTHGYGTAADLEIIGQALLMILIFVGLVIANTFWVTKVFTSTNWGNRKFPELNKKLHDSKYSAEFFPQDFPANNIIEIPLFKNMYMDYEATGDFAEQLQKISIIEHPFMRHVKKGLPFSKKRNKVIKKTNVYLWKCIVEFKDKPKDGQLTLRWT